MLSDRFLIENQGSRKGAGTLKDYMLGFNKLVMNWEGGVATIIKKKGATTMGAVWEVDEECISSLDK